MPFEKNPVAGGAVPEPEDPAERRRWLEEFAAACERVLIRDPEETTDQYSALLREDVAEHLARIRAELDASR